MNDSTAALEARWKSSRPTSGSVERSRPTIAPTKALTATSSENCAAFSRSPRRTGPAVTRPRRAAGRCGWRRTIAACCSGAGGMSRISASTNASSESNCSAVLWRRSKPIVETGVGRQAAAADRARVVRRVEHEMVGQRQQPLGQRAVQRARHLLDGVLAVGVQVRPAGVADQQRVSGQHQPRLIGAAAIADDVGVVRKRVAGGRDRLDHGVAELDDLAVAQRVMVEVARRRLRAGTPGRRCARPARPSPTRGRPARACRTPRRSARPDPPPARCSRRRGRRAGRRPRTGCASRSPAGRRRKRSRRSAAAGSTRRPPRVRARQT